MSTQIREEVEVYHHQYKCTCRHTLWVTYMAELTPKQQKAFAPTWDSEHWDMPSIERAGARRWREVSCHHCNRREVLDGWDCD